MAFFVWVFIKIGVLMMLFKQFNQFSKGLRYLFGFIICCFKGHESICLDHDYFTFCDYHTDTSKAKNFDDNIRVDCSHGIHFFITKEEALDFH